MSKHENNFGDVHASLSLTGSVQSLAQILGVLAGAGLASPIAIAAVTSTSAETAGANATGATKSTARTTKAAIAEEDAVRHDAEMTAAAAAAAKVPDTAGQTVTGDAADAGNARSSSEQATASAGSGSADVIPYDTVKTAFIALVASKGRDTGLAVLGTFGVGKATELKPEQYADFLAGVQAAAA